MQYHRHNRRKYLLLYHIIFVVKYRKNILMPDLTSTLRESLACIESRSDFVISEMEVDHDHLHLMIDATPTVSISQIVRRIKLQTTNAMWRKHSRFPRGQFWLEKTFWSDGYFAGSIGNASIDTVRQYIRTQG